MVSFMASFWALLPGFAIPGNIPRAMEIFQGKADTVAIAQLGGEKAQERL